MEKLQNKKGLIIGILILLIIIWMFFNSKFLVNQQANVITVPTSTNPSAQTGIYVASDWDGIIPEYVLTNQDISGVRIRLTWGKIQPAQNQYDFSKLNSEITRISNAGKAVSIAIATGPKGQRGPEWPFNPPVSLPYITLIEGSHQGTGNPNRAPSDFPVPWDPAYKAQIKNLITALKNNLVALPEYNNISQISTFGLSQKTDEMRVPDQDLSPDPSIPAGPASFASAIAKWNNLPVPFRPSVVKAAYKEILDEMMIAFPTKTIGSAFISGKEGFPYINEQGATVTRGNMPDIASEMAAYGKQTYGKRYSAMTNALKDTGGVSVVTTAHTGSISIGYQIENSQYGSPACLVNNTACDDTSLRAAFTRGKNAKAWFVEIFPKTLLAYPNAVKDFKGEFKSDVILPADTTSPTTPSNFSGSFSSNTITLSWSASTDNIAVTGYNLYRDGTLIDTTTSNIYPFSPTTPSTTYNFTLKAKDAAGNLSAETNVLTISTPAVITTGGGGGGGGGYIPPVIVVATPVIPDAIEVAENTNVSTGEYSTLSAYITSSKTTLPIKTKTMLITRKGIPISILQAYLANDKTLYKEGLITGYFGTLTRKAVMAFQEKHDLPTIILGKKFYDGIVGPKTMAKMNELYKKDKGVNLFEYTK